MSKFKVLNLLTTRFFFKLITSINFTQHTQDFASPSGHVLHASSWSNRPAKYPLFFCESQAFASADRCSGSNPFILLSYLFLFGSSSRVPLYLCGAMLQMPLVGQIKTWQVSPGLSKNCSVYPPVQLTLWEDSNKKRWKT